HGVVIADLDTGIDVLHPALFRADAGYYAWLDVNGDGAFTPGIDAVDLDGNGVPGAAETLRFFAAHAYALYGRAPLLDSDDGALDAGWDWLYADTDGSGAREVGGAAGFGEADPAYGEPLFVVDDV